MKLMTLSGAGAIEARLIAFFLRLEELKLKIGSRILVACSGGPDSVGLVRSLRVVSEYLPYKFHIGHVNHALRGRESDKDERFVRDLAKEVEWPCHVSRQSVKRRSGNLEELAREKRYEAFRKMIHQMKGDLVLTAHTLDDQVETILMNMMRGSGPDGMAGMSVVRHHKPGNFKLGRPFLGTTKAEILEYLKASKFSYRVDKSNRDDQFLRNWVRHRLIPLIESRSAGFKKRIANLADLMREEQAYWAGFVPRLQRQLLKSYRGGELLDFKKLLRYPPAVQRRFLRQVLGGDLMSFDAVEKLRRWMGAPPTGGRLWQLRKGWIAERLSKSTGSPSSSLFWLRQSRTKIS